MNAIDIGSLSEVDQGGSTAKDATRTMTAQELMRLGQQQQINAGKRPVVHNPSIRSADVINTPSLTLDPGNIAGI